MTATFKQSLRNTLYTVAMTLCLVTLLSSCASAQSEEPKSLGATVRSLNYSGKEVELTVVDPLDKFNRSGGDALNPYDMGGKICCFRIPARWHAGYQVIVRYTLYPDRTWYEQLVDVPPYPQGIAGNIWLAMHEDGRAEAVVSTFGPTRTEWPGRVKGLPVASKEYAQKYRRKSLATQKSSLAGMEEGLIARRDELSPEQVDRLKKAIEDTKNRIKLMEESMP